MATISVPCPQDEVYEEIRMEDVKQGTGADLYDDTLSPTPDPREAARHPPSDTPNTYESLVRVPGDGSNSRSRFRAIGAPVAFVVALIIVAGVSALATILYLRAVEPCLNTPNGPCLFGGTCTSANGTFHCDCPPGYTGTICKIDIDECASEPCVNAIVCIDKLDKFTCICQPGFTGAQCETESDECLSEPCFNDGTCEDQQNSFICHCNKNYADPKCLTYIDPCEDHTCNNGECTIEDGDPLCTCEPGYMGQMCETDIDECESAPCRNGATCIDLVDDVRCVCHPGFYGEFCDVGKDGAFCFTGGYDQNYHSSKVTFRYELLSNGNIQTSSKYLATVPEEQTYLTSFSVGIFPNSTMRYVMQTTRDAFGFDITSTAHGASTTYVVSREIIGDVPSTMYMKASGRALRGGYLYASFCGVSLQSTMRPLVAFSAYRSVSWSTAASVLSFQTIRLNAGDIFQSLKTFTAPRWGVYFFTYSAALNARKGIHLQLRVNGVSKFSLIRDNTAHNGQDLISRTAMLELNPKNEVELYMASGSISSCSLAETSFAGFLYSPRGARQAWSVSRTTGWDGTSGSSSEVLHFDGVLVNEGDPYNVTTGEVTVQATGVYFITVNIGLTGDTYAWVHIQVNGRTKESMYRNNWHNGNDMMSRSITKWVTAGSTVRIKATSGSSLFRSDAISKQTSFHGMLMYT